MSTQNTKRKRWPWAVGGGIGAVVLIVGGAVAYNELKPDNTPGPVSTSVLPPAPSSTPRPTGSAPTFDGRGPNGCAGGEAINADMVLNAQAEAEHNTDGAVEVAAAFTRWLVRSPLPSQEEAQKLERDAMAQDAKVDDLAVFVAQSPELLPTEGTEAHLSTLNGVWQIESSAADAVTASIGTRILVDGAVDPANAGSVTVDVKWEDGAWKIVNGEFRVAVDVLFQNGIEFDGGC